MGMESLKIPKIYETIGGKTTVDIPVKLTKDRILKVSKKDFEFIPFQQSFTNRTTLNFDDYPKGSGVYNITDQGKIIRHISFNFPRVESQLDYLDLDKLNASSKNDNVDTLFQNIEKDNSINELWIWFVILALTFICIEVLIQKFLK